MGARVARVNDDDLSGRFAEKLPFPLRWLLLRPRDSIAAAAAGAAVVTILVNALFMQSGPHPAPIFSTKPAPVVAPLGAAVNTVAAADADVARALVEHGTVSSAAAALNVSQPAMSKSLAQLEADSGLRLFDRVKGRLAPTEQGMRLYAEIDRIFSGLQQVENAIDAKVRAFEAKLEVRLSRVEADRKTHV